MEEARKTLRDSIVNDMTVEKLIQMTEIVGIHGAVNEDYPDDFLDILLLMADESVVTISVKY